MISRQTSSNRILQSGPFGNTHKVEVEKKGLSSDDVACAWADDLLFPLTLLERGVIVFPEFLKQQECDTPATPDWIMASVGMTGSKAADGSTGGAPPTGGGLDWLSQAAQPESAAAGKNLRTTAVLGISRGYVECVREGWWW